MEGELRNTTETINISPGYVCTLKEVGRNERAGRSRVSLVPRSWRNYDWTVSVPVCGETGRTQSCRKTVGSVNGMRRQKAVLNRESAKEMKSFEAWLGAEEYSTNTREKYFELARRLVAAVGVEPSAAGVKAFVVAATTPGPGKERKNSTWNFWFRAIAAYSKYRTESGKANGFAAFLKIRHGDDRDVDAPLSREELDGMIRAAESADDHSFALMLRVSWDTLGRIDSDILPLRWRDVSFKPNPAAHTDATVTFPDGKTGKRLRGFIWSPGLADELRAFRETAGPDDWIFEGPRNGHLGYETASWKFRRYASLAGIGRRVHWHLVRAGAATWLDLHNVPLSVIQMMGRWRSLQALQKYLRPTDDALGASLGKLRGD